MPLLLDADTLIERLGTAGVAVELPSPYAVSSMPPLVLGRPTFLGGPPGVGKTSLALQYWRTSLEDGHPSAFITLEMTPEDLVRRFERQFDSPAECHQWLRDYDAKISDVGLDAEEIEKVILNNHLDLVVIDHIHELDFSDRRELERILGRIGHLAPRTNTALLILAQMKRPGWDQEEPSKSDWRETGRIEQIGAVLLQFWQPDEHSDEAQLYCTKSRFTAKPPPLDLELDRTTVTFHPASPVGMVYNSYE